MMGGRDGAESGAVRWRVRQARECTTEQVGFGCAGAGGRGLHREKRRYQPGGLA